MASIGAPWPAAVAVSGGSDSIALMHLLARWARNVGVPAPVVLTVDHKLQADSAARAKAVVSAATSIGLKAHVLRWNGRKPQGNIEANARTARYALMGNWCRAHGAIAVYVGHTLDDQAETFLLRLARGTGLDGLAAMAPVSRWPVPGYAELLVVRPLLGVEREQLRQFLRCVEVTWSEDPMNAELRFARSRIRAAWTALEDVGLTKPRLAATATHMARARSALEAATDEFLACSSQRQTGSGYDLDSSALSRVPREIGLRALAQLLKKVAGSSYRPRFERLERLFDAIVSSEALPGRTLLGCRVARSKAGSNGSFGDATITIRPEPGRLKPTGASGRN